MHGHHCCAVAVFFAATAVPPALRAAPRLRLDWRAPAECPERSSVEAEVVRLLSGSAEGNNDSRGVLVARARVTGEGGRFVVQILTTLRDSVGERSLEGDSCASVAAATALILAMALDPDAVRGAPAAPPPPVPPPRVPPAPVPIEATAPVSVVPPEPPRWQLRPSLLGGFGALPTAAFGFRVAAGFRSGATEMGASAHYLLPVDANAAARPDAGGQFGLSGGALEICLPGTRGDWRGRGCAGLTLERLAGAGFGVTDPDVGIAWLASPLLRGGLDLQFTPRLAFGIGVALLRPMSRPMFVIDGVGSVWRPGALSGRVDLGLSVGL